MQKPVDAINVWSGPFPTQNFPLRVLDAIQSARMLQV